jgi:hypothetical protein
MSRSVSALVATIALLGVAGIAAAQGLEPDHYLCYTAGAAASKRVQRITKVRVDVRDRYGGPQTFAVQRFGALCNPASLDGAPAVHANIHLAGINIKALKGAQFTPFTQGVQDVFATRTLGLTSLASILDVTPAQPGTNAPADFSDDPTKSQTETNRFKCYAQKLPKHSPKFEPPAAPVIVTDEVYPNGQQFILTKVNKLCVPADVEGATPDAPSRTSWLVCYAVKLPKGSKFPRQMLGTRSRSVGVRIVGRRKPSELCVVARVFPGS